MYADYQKLLACIDSPRGALAAIYHECIERPAFYAKTYCQEVMSEPQFSIKVFAWPSLRWQKLNKNYLIDLQKAKEK